MDGLERFREAFADYTENYVIIGGTACELNMADTVVRARPRMTSTWWSLWRIWQKPLPDSFGSSDESSCNSRFLKSLHRNICRIRGCPCSSRPDYSSPIPNPRRDDRNSFHHWAFGRRRSNAIRNGIERNKRSWQRWDGTVSQCGSASWSQTRERKHRLLLPLRWTISIYRTAPLLIQGLKKRASWSRQLNRSLTRRAVCLRQFNVFNPPYWWGKTIDKMRWDLRCQCCNAIEKDLLQGSEWSSAT